MKYITKITVKKRLLDIGNIFRSSVYVTDAVPVKRLHKKNYGIPGDTFGIHGLSKNDSPEYVAEFLEQDGFVPVVVSGGCMDDTAAGYAHMFLFGDYPFMDKRETVRAEIRKIRNFLHDNTDMAGRELKDFHKRNDFKNPGEGNMLYYPLLFAARMCCRYYRDSEKETE